MSNDYPERDLSKNFVSAPAFVGEPSVPTSRPTNPTDGQAFKDVASGRNIVWDAATNMWRDAASGAPA